MEARGSQLLIVYVPRTGLIETSNCHLINSLDDCFAPILLKKSNVAGLRKSRECQMFAISDASKAIQNRCESPSSVLRSLTSRRVRRTSGPENFWSYGKRDFFNNIRQKRICASGIIQSDHRMRRC